MNCSVIVVVVPGAQSRTLVESTRLFTTAVSFGSVHSTISLPCYMSHASIPDEVSGLNGTDERSVRPARDLVRVSVGIEAVRDLVDDLDAALQHARAEHRATATNPP